MKKVIVQEESTQPKKATEAKNVQFDEEPTTVKVSTKRISRRRSMIEKSNTEELNPKPPARSRRRTLAPAIMSDIYTVPETPAAVAQLRKKRKEKQTPPKEKTEAAVKPAETSVNIPESKMKLEEIVTQSKLSKSVISGGECGRNQLNVYLCLSSDSEPEGEESADSAASSHSTNSLGKKRSMVLTSLHSR